MATIKKWTIHDKHGREHLLTLVGKGFLRKTYTAKIQVMGEAGKRLGTPIDVLGIKAKPSEVFVMVGEGFGPANLPRDLIQPQNVQKGWVIVYGKKAQWVRIKRAEPL